MSTVVLQYNDIVLSSTRRYSLRGRHSMIVQTHLHSILFVIITKQNLISLQIDGTTGVISTTVDVRTTCNCTGSSFTMTVTATDAGGLTATMQLVVFITETTTAVATTTTDRWAGF